VPFNIYNIYPILMASKKEDIQSKNLKENNKVLSEQISLAAELADKFKDVYGIIKEKSTLDKISNDVLKQALKITQGIKSEFDSVKDVQNDIVKANKAQNDIQKQILAVTEKGGKSLEKELDILKKRQASYSKAEDSVKSAERAVKEGIKGAKQQLDLANANLETKRAMYDSAIETMSAEAEMVTHLEDQNQQLEKTLGYLAEQKHRQENLANASKGLVNNIERVGNIFDKIGLGGVGKVFTDAAAKAKTMAYELTEGGKKGLNGFQKMRVAATALGGALKVAMGPMAIIGLLVSGFQKFKERAEEAKNLMAEISQQTMDFGRSLGMSSSMAAKVAGSAKAIGGAMGMTREQSVASAEAIYGQLQGVEKLSDKTMKTFMKLNVHGGIAAETLGRMYTMSKLTGASAGLVANNIAKTSQEMIKTQKVNVSMKTVMNDVANVSNRMLLSSRGYSKPIVSAVIAAKKLGIEMSKVEDIANSLLNIEDSIGAEMEAELLTGKELNLEKAREAALNGDNEALMAALAEQGITAADYGKMNRIQQEALGKALGMSGEEMAKMLVTQKQNEATNQGLLDTQHEGIDAMTTQASLAESIKNLNESILLANKDGGEAALKWEETMARFRKTVEPLLNMVFIPILDTMSLIMEKVTSIIQGFVDAREEGLGVFDAIGKVWSNADGLSKTLMIVAGTIATIRSAQIAINVLTKAYNVAAAVGNTIMGIKKGIQAGILLAQGKEEAGVARLMFKQGSELTKSVGLAIMKVIGALASLGPLGWGLGIAATATIAGLAAKYMNDGVISPSSGGGGYGDRVLYGPEGAISFNNKDTIVAGTNLFGNDVASGPDAGQAGGGNGAVVAELQRVSSLLQQILGKEGGVYIDGSKVGNTLALSNYKQQ
jgi:hypothetical protein